MGINVGALTQDQFDENADSNLMRAADIVSDVIHGKKSKALTIDDLHWYCC
jgi:hypothetical protein